MKEIWKAIKGYNGLYEVSNKGRVRSWKNGPHEPRDTPIIFKKRAYSSGYLYVQLSHLNKKKHDRIHRLVAKTFIPNPENKPQVNHKDGDKTNNNVYNLEWCTREENEKHALENGLKLMGEAHANSKLKRCEVLQIRSIYEQGWASLSEISKSYDIAVTTVSSIINRKSWKHV